MATKIQPIAKQETVNYGDNDVKNFWIPRSEGSHSGHKDSIKRLLQNVQNGFICVYSEKLEDKDIIKLLFDLSEKVRVYVLVNEYSSEMDILKGKVLIRYSGINNLGSFVLVNPNSNAIKGMFFGGQLTEGSLLLEHISFSITSNEVKELFRHFCFMFWECAKTEIIEKGEVEVKAKPLDIYYDTDRFGGKDYAYGTLFKFVENDYRKNLVGKNIVYCGNEKQLPTSIQAKTTQDLGDNKMKALLPKKEFEEQEPIFKDDEVSIQIEYTWQNVPFYLPENAKEHNLYSQWETEKGKITRKIESLKGALSELERRENTISKKLVKFFLGKKQKFEELKNQIGEIECEDFPIIAKEKRDKYIEKINSISADIKKHGVDITNENDKAKLEDEIGELGNKIKEKEKELGMASSVLDKQKSDLASKLRNFCAENKIEESKFGFIKDSWNKELKKLNEQIKKATDANKKPEERKELENEAEALENKIKSLETFLTERKTAETFIKKEEETLSNIKKSISALRNQVESKEKEIKKIEAANNNESKSSISAFYNDKNKKHKQGSCEKSFGIENLPQLPQVGVLFLANGSSYLAIENWEEYEQGKTESKRLNAKLCAKKSE